MKILVSQGVPSIAHKEDEYVTAFYEPKCTSKCIKKKHVNLFIFTRLLIFWGLYWDGLVYYNWALALVDILRFVVA